MAYINSDQFNARGLWSPTATYKKPHSKQPFADMVLWPVTVGVTSQPGIPEVDKLLLPKVPGFFAAIKDSTNQAPTFSGSAYWKLIRLNQ